MAKQQAIWQAWLADRRGWVSAIAATATVTLLWQISGSKLQRDLATSAPIPTKNTAAIDRSQAMFLGQVTAEAALIPNKVTAILQTLAAAPNRAELFRHPFYPAPSSPLAPPSNQSPIAANDLSRSITSSLSQTAQPDELTRSLSPSRPPATRVAPLPTLIGPDTAAPAENSASAAKPRFPTQPEYFSVPKRQTPRSLAELPPLASIDTPPNRNETIIRDLRPTTESSPPAPSGGSSQTIEKNLEELESPQSPTPPSPTAPPANAVPTLPTTEFTAIESPLVSRHPMMPTAQHLRQGELFFDVRNRLFFLPGSVEESGTGANPNLGFTWGITDTLELSLEAQRVDPGSPLRQGGFTADRNPDRSDFENKLFFEFQELALDLKQQIWQNASQTQSLSGVLSLAWGSRPFSFRQNGRVIDEGEQEGITPALQFPFTTQVNDRFRFTVSPTLAFFNQKNALHLHQSPIDDPGTFGTTFGLGGAISYNLTPDFVLWGDAFFPLTGNNSVSRSSGRTAKTLAYNAGLRYLVNPRVALDVFASNTLGSTGPLALTADRGRTALGVGISFMPDFIAGNRRYPNRFGEQSNQPPTPKTVDGLAFFDGGTIPGGRFHLDLQGGSQGVLAALRYGMVEDLEVGLYLDYVAGEVDESEQGISGKVRLLNQATGDPLTLSVATTLSLPNEPFVNFINNKRSEFKRLDLDKSVPFLLDGDDDTRGQLFIATVSLPLQYQFESGAAVWFTPTWGFVQRNGTEIAGFNLGGSIPVSRDLSVLGEVGANFAGEGNAFFGETRANAIPWSVGLRWDPTIFLGIDPEDVESAPFLQLYLTNRVGASPFHDLRVRADNDLAVGVGFSIPF